MVNRAPVVRKWHHPQVHIFLCEKQYDRSTLTLGRLPFFSPASLGSVRETRDEDETAAAMPPPEPASLPPAA